jgi:iron-sulfur cluster assembly accessory protein
MARLECHFHAAMIQISPAALQEILRLKARRNDPALRFRLGVQAGSCLDLSYQMSFDSTVTPTDQTLDYSELQVVIDAGSFRYLHGLMLDYTEDLMGGGFRFRNPNATQTCGCGYSFSAV